MNDRLAELIREALKPRLIRRIPEGEPNAGAEEWEQPGVEEVANAVRDWLSLPPSEEEIEAAAKAYDDFWRNVGAGDSFEVSGDDQEAAKAALVASRAVLVPPPEDAR